MANLIQCGDHKWARASCVCVHLLGDPTLEWVESEAEPGEQSDYLCPACTAKLPDVAVEDLKAICIHCVRRIKGLAET